MKFTKTDDVNYIYGYKEVFEVHSDLFDSFIGRVYISHKHKDGWESVFISTICRADNQPWAIYAKEIIEIANFMNTEDQKQC